MQEVNTLARVAENAERVGLRVVGTEPRLALPNGRAVPILVVEGARNEIRAPQWQRLKRSHPEGLVVAHAFVNPRQAERYRDLGIPFLDAAGNAWLEFPGLHVWVEGKRAPEALEAGQPGTRAFTPAGLRLVFVILVRPDLVGRPVRELASASGISVGAAQAALRSLHDLGHLPDRGTARIHRRQDLVSDWVGGYLNRLLPRLQKRAARGPEPAWWLRLAEDPRAHDWTIAGEAVASGVVRANTTTLFATPPWLDATRAARLRVHEPETNVLLRERFWNEEALHLGPMAPPLLTYAELLASGDARQREAAQEMSRDA